MQAQSLECKYREQHSASPQPRQHQHTNMVLSSKVSLLAAICAVLLGAAAGSPQLGLGGYYGSSYGGHGLGHGHASTYSYSSLHDDHHGAEHGKYLYKYSVHDPHTGDIKSAHESGHGGVVSGEYSLVQPDGVTRTVHYTADKHSGFNAIVHNSKPHHLY